MQYVKGGHGASDSIEIFKDIDNLIKQSIK